MDKIKFFNKRFVEVLPSSVDDLNYVGLNDDDVSSEDEQLLNYIFSIDPILGYPCGDLAVFNNKNTRAEVRDFISRNLLKDVSDTSSLSLTTAQKDVLSKFSDDDIASLSRNHGESKEDYASRLKSSFLDMRYKHWKDNHLKKMRKIMSDKS